MKTKRSESIAQLAAALAVAQGAIKTAAKDAEADTGKFKYQYATLDSIWDACRKPLSDNGLSVIQIPANDEDGFHVETILAHSSGEWISGTMTLPVVAGRMNELQAMGSAITYARRYALAAMIGVASGADDDGQSAGQISKPQEAVSPKKPLTMTPKKLLTRLQAESRNVAGFYQSPDEILAIRREGTDWPAQDDIDGWRQLFEDARDHALETEAEAEESREVATEIMRSNGDDDPIKDDDHQLSPTMEASTAFWQAINSKGIERAAAGEYIKRADGDFDKALKLLKSGW